jgi:uncharacterized OB-fold protein
MSTQRPLPDPDHVDFADFWAGTAAGELRVPGCNGCGRHVWPPRMACPSCAGLAFTWAPVGNRGVLFSWTTIGRAAVAGFEDAVPYTVAVVEAESDPQVRFVGLLTGVDRPEIGSRLVAEFVDCGEVSLVHWRRPGEPH